MKELDGRLMNFDGRLAEKTADAIGDYGARVLRAAHSGWPQRGQTVKPARFPSAFTCGSTPPALQFTPRGTAVHLGETRMEDCMLMRNKALGIRGQRLGVKRREARVSGSGTGVQVSRMR